MFPTDCHLQSYVATGEICKLRVGWWVAAAPEGRAAVHVSKMGDREGSGPLRLL